MPKRKKLQKRSWQPCGLTAVERGSISSKSQKLIAEALGNPRNYPLDERVFAAFGYLSDSVRAGALRFARWCAYRTASPPIGLLVSHRALFRIFPCPSEPPIPIRRGVRQILPVDLPRKNTDSAQTPVRARLRPPPSFRRAILCPTEPRSKRYDSFKS